MVRTVRAAAPPVHWLRSAGTLTATSILIFALGIAVWAVFTTRASLSAAFAEQARIQDAQLALEQTLKIQLDEENNVRAFVITRDPAYASAYRTSVAEFTRTQRHLRRTLAGEALRNSLGVLADYDTAQHDWEELVAAPLLNHRSPAGSADFDRRGKMLIYQQLRDARNIEGSLAALDARVRQRTADSINKTLFVRLFG